MNEIIFFLTVNRSHFTLAADTICVAVRNVLEAGDDLVALAAELGPLWLLACYIIRRPGGRR